MTVEQGRPQDASSGLGVSSQNFVRRSSGLFVPRHYAADDDPDDDDLSRAPYVTSEIETSISFVGVEFVVCTALLLFNTKALVAVPLTGFALLCAFVAFLMGGLTFAVASGAVARGPKGLNAARAALEWGNVLTEWFGLYLVLFALPVIVGVATNQLVAGAIACGVTVASYLVYVASGYDILGRFVSGFKRIVIHCLFILLLCVHWWGTATGAEIVTYVGGGAYIALATICATWHRLRGEFF